MMIALLALAVAASPLERAGLGDWGVFELDGGGNRRSYLRIAAVGAEPDALGRDALWLELEIALEPTFASPIARMALLAARSAGLGPGGVSRLLWAVGAAAPEEVPPEHLERLLPIRLEVQSSSVAPPGTKVVRARLPWSGAGRQFLAQCAETRRGGVLLHRICAAVDAPLLGLLELAVPSVGQSVRLWAAGTAASRRMPAVGKTSTMREVR